jgi:multidrug efflux pump
MNISEVFIKRPVATTLLTAGIILAGVVAFRILPVSPLPQVDFPTISVSASLPGADPETMATSVAAPLERQFGRIAGVTEMTSTSNRGSTSIIMQFELSRDINGAARDVQAAINAARGYLPANLPNNPTYRKVNPANAPILIIALTSDTVQKPEMYDIASTVLQQRLSQVKGVGEVFAGGSSLPAVRVDLNPLQLSSYGINLEDVRAALAATNANRPKGQLTNGGKTWEIYTNDQLHKADEYKNLVVAYRSGRAVFLKDVADVHESIEDVRTAGFVNGKPAVMLVIFSQPGANIIETVDSIRAIMPELKADVPQDVDMSVVLDRTPPIRASLSHVELTLVLAAILVILVVFAFLRTARATVIPGVAITVSIIGTFGIMYLLGYSLDNLSLMALTVSTGFVVDDAIVVLENVTRHIENGEKPFQAALMGTREISFTVVSMSLSLIAVFTPLLLMGGIVGRLFREFAVVLSSAVFVSLVASLSVTPMMCAVMLRPGSHHRHNWAYRTSEAIFNWMHRTYEWSLSWALKHHLFMILLLMATVGVSIYLFRIVPKGFFPEQDNGRIVGNIQAAENISFQAMSNKLSQVVGIIKKDPEVQYVIGFTGGGGSTTNTARMFIALKPFAERKSTMQQITSRLRKKLAVVPGAPTYLQPVQDLRVGGRVSSAMYQYTIQGDSQPEVSRWSQRLVQEMRSLPQLTDVNSDLQNRGLQATLVIDRPTAARLGITTQTIDNTLYDAFGQRQVSITYTALNQYHVVMEVAPRFWQHPSTLKDIYVLTPDGTLSPLSAFTHYEPTNTTLAVNHQGQYPSVTASFNLAPGASLGDAVKAVGGAARKLVLPGNIHGSFSGTAEAFQTSLANEPLLILAALLSVYIVLGILYESYVHPVTILSTLPSAGVGAMLALMLTGTDLSVIAIIGVILLIGIVKKNGIMMVDFALEAERKDGKSPRDAIFQACLLRFRPIMMTTMAALLGAVPLAIGGGVGAELRRPLGLTIVGGLIFSQALTLYTTPVVYLYLDRFRLFMKGLKRRR